MAKSKTIKRRSRKQKASKRKHVMGRSHKRSHAKSQTRKKHIKTSDLPKTRSKGISAALEHKLDLGKQQSDVAYDNMTLTQLQIMARNRGIPFGGLPRDRLIRKINMYR